MIKSTSFARIIDSRLREVIKKLISNPLTGFRLRITKFSALRLKNLVTPLALIKTEYQYQYHHPPPNPQRKRRKD